MKNFTRNFNAKLEIYIQLTLNFVFSATLSITYLIFQLFLGLLPRFNIALMSVVLDFENAPCLVDLFPVLSHTQIFGWGGALGRVCLPWLT